MNKFIPGSYRTGNQYRYFLPSQINREWQISDPRIIELVEQVALSLGELNSFARYVPDVSLFIQSYVTKEAVTSSRIEGTKTNIQEAFYNELDIDPEFRDDWMETRKYLDAMNFALERMERLPVSSRLLKETHKILLSHVRGRHKGPGEFRRSQNWIGGSSINTAIFVPPSAEHIGDLMSDLEKFLHNDSITLPVVIKAAIAHYQFETIHPFLDGNGRIGRLLIPLYLASQGMLERPLLHISVYFEKYRALYYDKLTLVREKGDLEGWVTFFLTALSTTSREAVVSLKAIVELKERITTGFIAPLGRKSGNASKLLDHLFTRPVVSTSEVKDFLGVSLKSAISLISDFEKANVLFEVTGYKRNRIFIFREYMDVLRG